MENIKKGAIISGGMGDIGRAIAERLAENKYSVFLLVHSSSPEEVKKFLGSLPGEAHSYAVCDLGREDEVVRAVEEAHRKLGEITVCIHAAVSPIVRKKISNISSAEFRQQFEVTTFGGFNLFHSVLPYMKTNCRGNIIALTTSAIEDGSSGAMAGYTVAKWALHGLMRELSNECKASGVSVSAMAPGFVSTKLHGDLPEKVLEFIKDRTPTSTPQEVAEKVAYILSLPQGESNGRTFKL